MTLITLGLAWLAGIALAGWLQLPLPALGLLALPGRVRKLTETTWTVKLVAGCEMDFVTSAGAVALACPGVDYMRLWPLPVVQLWESMPDPVAGRMAGEALLSRCLIALATKKAL